MMQLDKSDIESALLSKGFIREGTHHQYFHHEVNGKRTGISTYTSHGGKIKAYNDTLLNLMKKQLKLDRIQQLKDLIKCPMKSDDYCRILREKGLLK